jgi:hypothetical protein
VTNTEKSDDPKVLRQQRLTKAYGTATNQLRDAHRDEFNQLYAKAAEELGEKWEPKLTEEQKAAQQMREILAKFPNLKGVTEAGIPHGQGETPEVL